MGEELTEFPSLGWFVVVHNRKYRATESDFRVASDRATKSKVRIAIVPRNESISGCRHDVWIRNPGNGRNWVGRCGFCLLLLRLFNESSKGGGIESVNPPVSCVQAHGRS